MIKFLVELPTKFNIDIHPTPTNDYPKKYNVYELNIKPHPEETYWTDWGGHYDNFTGTQIELYYEKFLQKANNITDLLNSTEPSLFIDSNYTVYINIPKHPWLYSDYSMESETVIPFLSTALSANNPSDLLLREVPALVKLEEPNFNIKLSDNIAGVTLNQSFDVTLINNDGFFDDEEKWNLLNTPLYLKKSINENTKYEDFKIIRNGLIENTTTTFDKLQISVSDSLRAMGEPICNVIKQINYAGITVDEKSIDKNIPIVYGKKKVKLIKLDDTHYVAAEKITTLHTVYDRDDTIITGSLSNNIITSTKEADTALITGYTDNNIGKIIIDLITRKTSIQYSNSNYNMQEVDKYLNLAPKINITLTGGSVKKAIQDILKNDLAFFIQQMNGRFTIRKYGEEYTIHNIPSWLTTKKPERSWDSAQENYFSSCVINYDYIDDEQYKSYLYSDRENWAESNYRKKVTRTFDTDIVNKDDAIKLSSLLSDRYTEMKQTIKYGVGIDTSDIELLDTVIIDVDINDRLFTKNNIYYAKEINPAQDIIVLESAYSMDITGEYPNTTNYTRDYDNLFAYTLDSEYEQVIDGGMI